MTKITLSVKIQNKKIINPLILLKLYLTKSTLDLKTKKKKNLQKY